MSQRNPQFQNKFKMRLPLLAGLLATAHSYTLSERPWMDKSLAADKRAELLVKNMVCSGSLPFSFPLFFPFTHHC